MRTVRKSKNNEYTRYICEHCGEEFTASDDLWKEKTRKLCICHELKCEKNPKTIECFNDMNAHKGMVYVNICEYDKEILSIEAQRFNGLRTIDDDVIKNYRILDLKGCSLGYFNGMIRYDDGPCNNYGTPLRNPREWVWEYYSEWDFNKYYQPLEKFVYPSEVYDYVCGLLRSVGDIVLLDDEDRKDKMKSIAKMIKKRCHEYDSET